MSIDHRTERKSVHQRAFDHYLRTGERLTDEEWLGRQEHKFNPYHDARGRFTSPPGVTVSYGRAAAQISGMSKVGSISARATPTIKTVVTGRIGGRRKSASVVDVEKSRSRVTKQSSILPPRALHARARAFTPGSNELLRMPDMEVVLFGPGVSLIPVPVATFQEFDGAAKLATRMHDLDAVITGPQFALSLTGSEALHGQAMIGGRVFGNSAPSLYYFATVRGANGIKRLEFGKGDPPKNVEVGIGGGVPMILAGQDVPGYNIAWNKHRGVPSMGKNIVAYDSISNTSAIFVQQDGRRGMSLRQFVDYIKRSGFDYALMFDGSGSASLTYRRESIVSPELVRQPIILLGIGFRSAKN